MLIVIVDFDNYFRETNLDVQKLEFALSNVIRQCEKTFSGFRQILIRLYGGWYQETSLTKQASQIQQLLSQIHLFPKILGTMKLNGSIELVSQLYELPTFKWFYTYKEKHGLPRLRINHNIEDGICTHNKDICPKYILNKFTSHKGKTCSILGCKNSNKEIFKTLEQKMVDTMIACDIISVANMEDIKGIFVLSDDQDHFPSYAIASEYLKKERKTQCKISVGIRNAENSRKEFISKMLEFFNIEIISMV